MVEFGCERLFTVVWQRADLWFQQPVSPPRFHLKEVVVILQNCTALIFSTSSAYLCIYILLTYVLNVIDAMIPVFD